MLLGVLAAVSLVWIYMTFVAGAPSAGDGRTSQNIPRVLPATAAITAPDVHTEALAADRPRPGANQRDLFTFKPRYVAPAPAARVAPAPVVPSGPPPAPTVPPIPLKFIGLLEPGAGPRVAILSDGRGAPIYGREGEAVLGQYRILRIGAESIEIEYIDGRGRQAIRLSGS
jgi:hypothetical protein